VLLLSSITGTRPRILVPPKAPAVTQEMEEGNNPVKKAGQARGHRQSDIPKFVRYNDLPRTVCYGDIELFVIRNPLLLLRPVMLSRWGVLTPEIRWCSFFPYQPFSSGTFPIVLSSFLATIAIVPPFLSVRGSR
jgi:hypothetical protein